MQFINPSFSFSKNAQKFDCTSTIDPSSRFYNTFIRPICILVFPHFCLFIKGLSTSLGVAEPVQNFVVKDAVKFSV